MFGELRLDTFQTEAVLYDLLVRADFQPRGSILVYLNDRGRPFIPFENAELFPLAIDRQVGGMKQSGTTILNKSRIQLLSMLNEGQAEGIQLLAAKRPVVVYAGSFAVQGQLHVNADALNADIFEETKDFFAFSEASIYPLRPLATTPTRQVPVLFVNRATIQAYAIVQPK